MIARRTNHMGDGGQVLSRNKARQDIVDRATAKVVIDRPIERPGLGLEPRYKTDGPCILAGRQQEPRDQPVGIRRLTRV